MRRSHLPIYSAVLLGWASALGQEARLAVESVEGAVWVSYDTVAGKTYELQQTADLVDWQGLGLALAGDGGCWADFNQDGWVDLVVGNLDEGYRLYQNQSGVISGNHWLAFELVGSPAGR